jgi:hypothetical protein
MFEIYRRLCKADEMMVLFNKNSGEDLRGKIFKSKQNYMDEIKANSGRYNIEDAGINSPTLITEVLILEPN